MNDYINNPDISVEVNNVLFGYCCLSLEENMLCVCLVFFFYQIHHFIKKKHQKISYCTLYYITMCLYVTQTYMFT